LKIRDDGRGVPLPFGQSPTDSSEGLQLGIRILFPVFQIVKEAQEFLGMGVADSEGFFDPRETSIAKLTGKGIRSEKPKGSQSSLSMRMG
jgi:hypothetical protein